MGVGNHLVLHQSHRKSKCICQVPPSGHLFEARITVLALCLIEWLLKLFPMAFTGLVCFSSHGLDREGMCVLWGRGACAVEGGQGRLFFLDEIYEVPYGGAT